MTAIAIRVGHTDRTNVLPRGAKLAVFSNEDIDFEASLVTGVNENHEFYLPVPMAIDRFEETFVVHELEFRMIDGNTVAQAGTAFQSLKVLLSYLDVDPSLTGFRGILTDNEDEFWKTVFFGPEIFGDVRKKVTATVAIDGSVSEGPQNQDLIYTPPYPLDQGIPMKIRFVNVSSTVLLATGVHTFATFTNFEKVSMRVWYTVRKLTSAEKSQRNSGMILQRLG